MRSSHLLCSLVCCLFFANGLMADVITLENDILSLILDRKTAGVTALVNKLTGERIEVRDQAFSIEMGLGNEIGSIGVLTPDNCTIEAVDEKPGEVSFSFTYQEVTGVLKYRLDGDDHFAEKTLELGYGGVQPYNPLFERLGPERVAYRARYTTPSGLPFCGSATQGRPPRARPTLAFAA